MNNFLEKLTNNIDIEPVAQEYIDFLLSYNKGKVAFIEMFHFPIKIIF